MQCTSPDLYRKDGSFIQTLPPCGACLACRMNDRHIWASRLVCERKSHSDALFITLTYRDESLPTSEKEAIKSYQDFIKRYRKNTGQQPRYFACMEYGSRNGRLHWHAIFFGEQTTFESRRSSKGHRIYVSPKIEDNWQNGSTYVKECNESTQGQNITQYVAGYILKDKWKPNDGKNKSTKSELGLQSRNPYIGHTYKKQLIDIITTRKGSERCEALGTIPARLKFGNRYYRLYHRIRKEVAHDLGYPYFPIPNNDGTIIDIDGQKIIREVPRIPKSYGAALAQQKSICQAIRRRRNLNLSTETG